MIIFTTDNNIHKRYQLLTLGLKMIFMIFIVCVDMVHSPNCCCRYSTTSYLLYFLATSSGVLLPCMYKQEKQM